MSKHDMFCMNSVLFKVNPAMGLAPCMQAGDSGRSTADAACAHKGPPGQFTAAAAQPACVHDVRRLLGAAHRRGDRHRLRPPHLRSLRGFLPGCEPAFFCFPTPSRIHTPCIFLACAAWSVGILPFWNLVEHYLLVGGGFGKSAHCPGGGTVIAGACSLCILKQPFSA